MSDKTQMAIELGTRIYVNTIESLEQQLTQKDAIIKVLTEAVEFYLEDDNWEDQKSDQKCPCILNGEDIYHNGDFFKGGNVAKQALEKVKGMG